MTRKAVSAQELRERAVANGYQYGAHREGDSVKSKTKYVPKTLKDQNMALNYYARWLESFPPDEDLNLRDGLPALDLSTTKDFLRYYASTAKGILHSRITCDSLNTFAEWFFAGFTRISGSVYDKAHREEVYQVILSPDRSSFAKSAQWVRDDLRAEGVVVNKKKPKHLFGKAELINFNITFWTVDEDCFIHPRNKVQVPFLMNLFSWTGARIGAFFPNGENKGQAGLRYRDLEMVLLRTSDRWKPVYRVDQRWVKNNRDPEYTVFGASTSQHRELQHDDTQFLIALAIADKAIFGINSVEDLWDLEIPQGADELPLRWNKDVENLPVLRKATMKGGVSKQPLPKSTFEQILKTVLKRSGYFGVVTIYVIRRGVGKALSERYTRVQLAQHLTQADKKVFGTSYMANMSSCDGKSAFLNEEAQKDHIEFF
ncbi:hypothetical protein ACLMJK_007690 [Lecanora helva]